MVRKQLEKVKYDYEMLFFYILFQINMASYVFTNIFPIYESCNKVVH